MRGAGLTRQKRVGKAQRQVLDILGIPAHSFQQAEARFAEIGIVVTSKRVGRGSVPVVKVARGGGFAQSEDGDYGVATAPALTADQRAALAAYMA